MGLLDDIADVATGKKTKKETHSYKMAQNRPESKEGRWMQRDDVQVAYGNAENMAADPNFQTKKQKEAEEAKKAAKVVTTTDGVVPKIVTEDKKKKIFTVGNMQVNERLYNLYQSLLDRGYSSKQAEQIIRLGVTEEEWADKNLVDLMSGEGIRRLITKDFKAGKEYENEFLGSAGAANILNKIHNAKTEGEKQKIMNDAMATNPEGFKKMFGEMGDPNLKQFEDTLVNKNEGNKNFDKNYHKTSSAYWELNPAQTSGAMEDMATAYQQGNLEMTKGNTMAIQQAMNAKQGQGLAGLGGGAGAGGAVPPVDPTDPDAGLMPSGTYLASQYNQALVPDPNLDPYQNAMYTGGPEQQHIAGGYWDPDKHEWVGGSPWGTQNLWQGANPTSPEVTSMAEGGPVRAPSSKVTIGGGGLFDFKPYGF